MEDPTRNLTAAIAAGDPEALGTLYDRWFDELYAVARRVTGRDESFCLDVIQDSMLRIVRSMPVIESEASLRGWLHKVVKTSAYDRIRREVRQHRRNPTIHESLPDEYLDERLRWLECELAQLEDRSVTLLVMRYRFGWTLERIGAALGIGTGAAHGRLQRVLRDLRDRTPGGVS